MDLGPVEDIYLLDQWKSLSLGPVEVLSGQRQPVAELGCSCWPLTSWLPLGHWAWIPSWIWIWTEWYSEL